MFTCKICNKTFNNITKLVSHLSHPKSSCKSNIKEYYDKFLKKSNEGICQFCGKETAFYGIEKGYLNDTCKHCKNNKIESKEIRKNNYKIKKESKKISNGYYNLPFQCMECSLRFQTISGLSKHISKIHLNISLKEYYDKYLKKENEGICPITNELTEFKNLKDGYYKYKGKGTNSKDILVQQKSKNTLFKNYNVINACEVNSKKRLSNYNDTIFIRKELKKHRFLLISLLKKLTIDKSNKLHCQICGDKFNTFIKISKHIKKHKLSIKEYYDIYFKKENEGICPISNLETNFDSFERGYFKYHRLFLTYTDEMKNGSKESQLKYIRNKINENEKIFNVKFLEINKLNYIGDLIKIQCLNCNEIYENRFTNLIIGNGKCPKCYPHNKHKSKNELEILEEVKSILDEKFEVISGHCGIIKNPKTGRNLELDIYIPGKNIAIEHNGLYWHSEEILEDPEHYHIIKLNECNKKGIQLIQIFEDEWNNKKEILISMLKHKLGEDNSKKIYGRKCEIKEIDFSTKNKFLDENHIQGKDTSKIKLGAFYNNELVALMTFSNGNISRGGNPSDFEKWELSRFCTKNNYNVIGIAGKLLEYFKRNYIWKEIYTYADLRFSNGNMYKVLGFEFEKQNSPSYFYIKGEHRIHRYNLRKLPHEPKEIPERILRYGQGYLRIWDCGILKFKLRNFLNYSKT